MRTFASIALFVAAAVVVAGCGPCGDVKRIGLAGEPKAQLYHDRAMLGRYWNRYNGAWAIRVELRDMMQHRDVADTLVKLGFLQRDGRNYAFTAKARAVALYRTRDDYGFAIEVRKHASVPPFLAAYETIACDETHSFNRVYTFHEYLGPLTPFGQALLTHGLLYIGHNNHEEFDGKPGSWEHRWAGPKEPLYFLWVIGSADDDPGNMYGDHLGLQWFAVPEITQVTQRHYLAAAALP